MQRTGLPDCFRVTRGRERYKVTDRIEARVLARTARHKPADALVDAQTVFGIIKSAMGFRQFSLRGLKQVSGEWNLVCLAWNLKRMAVLRQKFGEAGK